MVSGVGGWVEVTFTLGLPPKTLFRIAFSTYKLQRCWIRGLPDSGAPRVTLCDTPGVAIVSVVLGCSLSRGKFFSPLLDGSFARKPLTVSKQCVMQALDYSVDIQLLFV